MRANKLRQIWASGGAAVNGWLAVPNGFSAETMAHQGWDSLTVDIQHGVVDYGQTWWDDPAFLVQIRKNGTRIVKTARDKLRTQSPEGGLGPSRRIDEDLVLEQ